MAASSCLHATRELIIAVLSVCSGKGADSRSDTAQADPGAARSCALPDPRRASPAQPAPAMSPLPLVIGHAIICRVVLAASSSDCAASPTHPQPCMHAGCTGAANQSAVAAAHAQASIGAPCRAARKTPRKAPCKAPR